MSDVDSTPRVRCDNCGHVEDYTPVKNPLRLRMFNKPREWGHCVMEGARPAAGLSLGEAKEKITCSDLCPGCANAALDAAAAALKERRGEK